ncbi:MAG TPA: PqqD family protein [Bacillales bacterium]|nr:PqqD family protein [Bacillales bacterium]
MIKRRKRDEQNLLTMTPVLKERYKLKPSECDESARRLIVPRDSWLERLSVKWLHQPDSIKVRLDPLGSFVLARCDGSRTVEALAREVRKKFGEKAEPTVPRLVIFLRMVDRNGWIHWSNRK